MRVEEMDGARVARLSLRKVADDSRESVSI
jgi:hypothetical protein